MALRRASDAAVVDDIYANAASMRFTNQDKSLDGRKVFLAIGEYDATVPAESLVRLVPIANLKG